MAELLLAALLSSCPCLEHFVCPGHAAVKHHGHKLVIDNDTVIQLDGEEITPEEFFALDPDHIEIVRQKVHRGHVEWLELETVADEVDWV